jgi:ribosomal 50S subunit-associated protein YjgA (DUF615 family)
MGSKAVIVEEPQIPSRDTHLLQDSYRKRFNQHVNDCIKLVSAHHDFSELSRSELQESLRALHQLREQIFLLEKDILNQITFRDKESCHTDIR